MSNQVTVLHTVTGDLFNNGMTFSQGQKISNKEMLAAYLSCMYREGEGEECSLTVPEIIGCWGQVSAPAEDGEVLEGEDLEMEVLDVMKARQHGEVGEDVTPLMDIEAAHRVKADATNYGAKLPKVFSEHVNVFLDAIDDVKLACLICLDDVAGRVFMNTDTRNWKGGAWSKEEIIRLPVPGTKAPKGTVIDDGNRHHWDNYSYKEGKTVINSSFYLDAAMATDVGSLLSDKLEVLKAKTDPNDEDKKQKEIIRKRLNNVAKFLRDGVTVAKTLIEFERFNGAITYQVQREEDGSPQRGTPYPLRIWPQNAIGKAESFTLSNMKTMLKTNAKGENIADIAIAKGATFATFKAAMPAKERKTEGSIKVTTAKQFFMAADVIARFLPAGGTTLITKALDDKETGQGALDDFGSMMTVLGPIWENYKGDYAEMKAKERLANKKVA
jgi:hypothetical protein